MLPTRSSVRRSLLRGLPHSLPARPRRDHGHHTRRAATTGATAGLAVGAAAGVLPFILRATPPAANETERA
jgi:hypothetical protein